MRGNVLVLNFVSYCDVCGMRLFLLIGLDKGRRDWFLYCFYVVLNNVFDFFYLSEDNVILIKLNFR